MLTTGNYYGRATVKLFIIILGNLTKFIFYFTGIFCRLWANMFVIFRCFTHSTATHNSLVLRHRYVVLSNKKQQLNIKHPLKTLLQYFVRSAY